MTEAALLYRLHARRADRPHQLRQSASWPIYRELIDGYGLVRAASRGQARAGEHDRPTSRATIRRSMPNWSAACCAIPDRERWRREHRPARRRDGGRARRIEERVPVPVLDGMRCAIPQAEALRAHRRAQAVDRQLRADRASGRRSALDPALAAMLVQASRPIRTPLRQHGRYPYWPITKAPPFRWPQGEGLAVYVALNLEAYGVRRRHARRDRCRYRPQPDVLNYSWLDYGNRVGAWRILELCRSLELPLTVLVNSQHLRRLPGTDRGVSRRAAARSPRMAAPMRSGRGNCPRRTNAR